MNYPCGIIKDLLPLYVDDVCNAESRAAVDGHLVGCAACRECYENMKAANGLLASPVKDTKDTEDVQMVNSLKNIKKRLNKRLKVTIAVSLAVIAAALGAFYVLFNMPIRDVAVSDVAVTANVYPVGEMVHYDVEGVEDGDTEISIVYSEEAWQQNADPAAAPPDGEQVRISLGQADASDAFHVTIPELPNGNIIMSQDALESCGYITVISWSSPYFVQEIHWDEQNDINSDTLYVSDFKTTILNNKATEYNSTNVIMEMRQINRIVYVADDGTETTMWENETAN